jgi:hypothetical protein
LYDAVSTRKLRASQKKPAEAHTNKAFVMDGTTGSKMNGAVEKASQKNGKSTEPSKLGFQHCY